MTLARRDLRATQRRFWAKVVQRDDGCAIWTGATDPNGYGVFAALYGDMPAQRFRKAHQWAYEWTRGPVPAGLEIDHLCRVRNCVNPEHMEAVTHRVNMLRGETGAGLNAAKTHCCRGHAFTPENTYWRTGPRGNAYRTCRDCMRESRLQGAA